MNAKSHSKLETSDRSRLVGAIILALMVVVVSTWNFFFRATFFGPLQLGYVIGLTLSVTCALSGARLLEAGSRIRNAYLIIGILSSIMPELIWGGQDYSFYREVHALDPYLIEEDLVHPARVRFWPCREFSIRYSGGEFQTID